MKVEIIDKTSKRGAGGLGKNDLKLIRHSVAEASDLLYNDLLKRANPELIQVIVSGSGSALGFYNPYVSDENHIRIHIADYLLRYSPEDLKCVVAHELVHGADMPSKWRKVFSDHRLQSGHFFDYLFFEMTLIKISKWRGEGVAKLGERLMYGDSSLRFLKIESKVPEVLDAIIRHFEQVLEDRYCTQFLTNSDDVERYYSDADIVLLEAMKGLGLITDDDAYGYYWGFYTPKDSSCILQAALSMSLSQFIEGILIASVGKSALVEKMFSYCAHLQERRENDQITLFTLLTEERYVKVDDYNEVMEQIVGNTMPDEDLEQMVKALHEAPDGQTSSGALKMIDQLYEYFLQYKDDTFYEDYAKAANWSLNYYFMREDLIHDDLLFWGKVDDMVLMDVTQRMIEREMATALEFRLNNTGDGLVVTDNLKVTGVYIPAVMIDLYIPAWYVFEGKPYPVVEVVLGNTFKLASIYIPETVTSIKTDGLWGDSKLSSIIVAEKNTRYDSRDRCNAIIETATNKLIVGCKTTTIPYSVTSIGDRAFCNCVCEDLIIPDEVVEIAPDAFRCFKGTIYFRDPSMINAPNAEVNEI